MKVFYVPVTVCVITVGLLFTACEGDGGGGGDASFNNATNPGQKVEVTVGNETVNMVYANSQESITFPYSPDCREEPVDSNTGTLTRKFFLSDTQVTNALMVEVLQWAYDNGKFSTTVGDHNGLDSSTVKYGQKELLDLDAGDPHIKINYSGGNFTIDSGYEDHPVVNVTLYGAIMFCNWLTEMRDGNTNNVVYKNIPTDGTWNNSNNYNSNDDDESGYRLPSSEEWEYAARYIGTTEPTEGDLATEYVAKNVRDGDSSLTDGYYWTPRDYASGATADYNNSTASELVAVYDSSSTAEVKSKAYNALGLYDISGNVWEWCFTTDTDNSLERVMRGACWFTGAGSPVENLRLGFCSTSQPSISDNNLGFRFARTQN